jgi:hypothetical protein
MSAPTLPSRERVLSSHNVGLSNSFARCHRLMLFEATHVEDVAAKTAGELHTPDPDGDLLGRRTHSATAMHSRTATPRTMVRDLPCTLLSRVTRRILAQPAPDVVSTMSRGSPPPPSVPSWQSDKHGLARPMTRAPFLHVHRRPLCAHHEPPMHYPKWRAFIPISICVCACRPLKGYRLVHHKHEHGRGRCSIIVLSLSYKPSPGTGT